MTLTGELSVYFSALKLGDIPDSAIRDVKRLFVDYFGVAIGGSRADSGRIARDFVVESGGRKESTVIGRGDRVPAASAAFANAIAEHSIELDDIDVEALFHYGPPVISASLAVAEATSSSGADTLAAAVAGCEMINRLSRAVNPALRDRGFHTTPTCGVFGATVAAARLYGLTADELQCALGLAGAQAGGLMEMYGSSMQKRFNPGPAARGGVTAARMAQLGFTGADTILEGERGFGAAISGKLDAAMLINGLSAEFTMELEFKPYSCARPIHNAIDCALEIRAREAVRPEDITSIEIGRHPLWAKYHLIDQPRTHHEAQMSLPFSVAVALTEGSALPAHYADERLNVDGPVMRLARQIRIIEDSSLQRGVSCRMIVTTRDGRRFESTVDYPKGSVQNPMTDADLVAKFGMLAGPTISEEKAQELATSIFNLERVPDVGHLMMLTY